MALNVSSYDLVTVATENVTIDLIVWRRYRNRALGVLEATLDANPHLAKLHRSGPFLPVGTQVRIPIDSSIIKGSPQVKTTVVLWDSK